jgi:hypothetical protein
VKAGRASSIARGRLKRGKKISLQSSDSIYNCENALYNLVSVLQGGIAQLGERLHGMQEVSGSIPLTSTKEQMKLAKLFSGRSEVAKNTSQVTQSCIEFRSSLISGK